MNTPQQQNLVNWAHWSEANKSHFIYTEGAQRMEAIGQWPLKFPISCDCSGFVTLLCNLAGLPDPNGQRYNHTGYTGTLLANPANHHIPASQVQPGDLVVYGAGTGVHTAIVIEVHGPDIMTVSHGDSNGPSYCWVNPPTTVPDKGIASDGRKPQTFLRLNQTQLKPCRLIPLH